MSLTSPCEFVRGSTGNAQTFRYKNKRLYGGYFSLLIVTGGPVDGTRSDRFMKDGCGTTIQAVILRARGVTVKNTVLGKDGKGPTSLPFARTR
jgi:hypothetical protein